MNLSVLEEERPRLGSESQAPLRRVVLAARYVHTGVIEPEHPIGLEEEVPVAVRRRQRRQDLSVLHMKAHGLTCWTEDARVGRHREGQSALLEIRRERLERLGFIRPLSHEHECYPRWIQIEQQPLGLAMLQLALEVVRRKSSVGLGRLTGSRLLRGRVTARERQHHETSERAQLVLEPDHWSPWAGMTQP